MLSSSCFIKQCQSNSDAKQIVKDTKDVLIPICDHCYNLFGDKLPSRETIRKRLEQHNTLTKENTKSEKIKGMRI